MMLAWLRLRRGDWAAAERAARGELERGTTVAQLLAKIVLDRAGGAAGDRRRRGGWPISPSMPTGQAISSG